MRVVDENIIDVKTGSLFIWKKVNTIMASMRSIIKSSDWSN